MRVRHSLIIRINDGLRHMPEWVDAPFGSPCDLCHRSRTEVGAEVDAMDHASLRYADMYETVRSGVWFCLNCYRKSQNRWSL